MANINKRFKLNEFTQKAANIIARTGVVDQAKATLEAQMLAGFEDEETKVD